MGLVASSREFLNHESPYTRQSPNYNGDLSVDAEDKIARDNAASMWCLRVIRIPSGGEIEVTYEADDYQVVQEKTAGQMVKILGTVKDPGDSELSDRISKNYTRVVFELEKPVTSLEELEAYVEGLDQVYFKTYQRLKKPEGYGTGVGTKTSENSFEHDYVEGYAELKSGTNVGFLDDDVTAGGPYTRAYIELEQTPISDKGASTWGNTHPFRKAGWQYLRVNRADLFQQPNESLDAVANVSDMLNVYSILQDLLSGSMQMLMGYYNYANVNGFCKKLKLSGSYAKPSYLRLNSPDGQKFGGGHRVAKIVVRDSWDDISSYANSEREYGTVYEYTLTDKTSSGVAAYEPRIGGEENPHKQPLRYEEERGFKNRDNNLYVEGPVGEMYYPGPSVGYSRVTVKSLEYDNQNVQKLGTGFSVSQFYTAKDFPTRVHRTEIEELEFKIPGWLPLVGAKPIQYQAYSQGFAVHRNDMHGKPKRNETWSQGANVLTDQPTTSETYFYHEESPEANGTRNLKSEVNVLIADGYTIVGELGKTISNSVFMRENFISTESLGTDLNLTIAMDEDTYTPWFLGTTPVVIEPAWIIPHAVPSISSTKARFRSVASTKVINKKGIVSHVIRQNGNSINRADNLAYDAETGQAVVTTVQNNFDAPVYTYNMPAHWSHEGMEGAYQNSRLVFSPSEIAAAGITVDDLGYLFYEGDVLMDEAGLKGWVHEVGGGKADVYDENNNLVTWGNFISATTGYVRVIRSGMRNQQGVTAAQVVALSDPSQAAEMGLFAKYNATTTTSRLGTALTPALDCFTQIASPGTFSTDDKAPFHLLINATYNSGEDLFEPSSPCAAIIEFDQRVVSDPATPATLASVFVGGIQNYNLFKAGNKVLAIHQTNNHTVIGKWQEIGADATCWNQCAADVLDASAGNFDDNWTYDETGLDWPANYSASNEYRYGHKGVYRAKDSYVFQIDRKQTESGPVANIPGANSQIRYDGTYEKFKFFEHSQPEAPNKPWKRVSTVTMYSHNGNALENMDALDIHSSALYGYDWQLPTAVSANARYCEIGFDGFEDYGSTVYNSLLAGQGHGHLTFTAGTGTPVLSSDESHTGAQSLKIPATESIKHVSPVMSTVGTSTLTSQVLDNDQKYLVTAWVKTDEEATLMVYQYSGGSFTTNATTGKGKASDFKNAIEGWKRLELWFETGTNVDQVEISVVAGTADVYVDDIRLMPYDSEMKTYVYDPVTHWLEAELDAQHYATFYNYDLDGNMVQVKKETARGIQTISTNTSNVRR